MSAIFSKPAFGVAVLAAAFAAVLAASPAQASDACHFDMIGALPLDAADPVATPAIQGAVNDKPVRMLLGTGMASTYLVKAEIDSQGLAMSGQGRRISGVNDTSMLYRVHLRDLAVGSAHTFNMSFIVIDIPEQPNYGAIIAMDFLSQADMEISLADKQVKFLHVDDCKGRNLAYWDSKAIDVPMEEVSKWDQRQLFDVEVNGQKVKAMVDTAAEFSTIDLASAERAGITPQSSGVGPAAPMTGIDGGQVPTYNAPFSSFTIGGETINNPHIRIGNWYRTGWYGRYWPEMRPDRKFVARPVSEVPQMLLGRDFLRTHHVLLSLSQHKMYFSYLGGQVFMSPPGAAVTAQVTAPEAGHGQP